MCVRITPTSKYFPSKMESAFTVRNAHPCHVGGEPLGSPLAWVTRATMGEVVNRMLVNADK